MTLLIESLSAERSTLGPTEFVELTWQERSKPHRRTRTTAGTEVALALPRGTVLIDGAVLYNTSERTIAVKAKPEPVMAIYPANQLELARIAHHLGNWHRSAQLEADGSILTEPDSPLAEWLDRQAIRHQEETRPYHPNLRGSAHD